MVIRAVVCDFDGTLIDSPTTMIPIIITIAQRLGLSAPSEAAVRRLWGMDFRAMLEQFWEPRFSKALHAALRSHLTDHPVRCSAYPGARETIRGLRRDGRAVVLHTNRRPEEHLDARLRDAGFGPEDFDLIAASREGIPPKPDPQSLLRVLHNLLTHCRINAHEEVCVVSDQTSDGEMALQCNCRFVGVLTGAASKEDFEPYLNRGIRVVRSIADAPGALDTF